jgi:hypothetical protein
MTDEERRALVADLVFEVMGLEMPCPREPTPSGGSGSYWKVGDRFMHDNDEHIGVAIGVFWDHWRRLEARRLIEERGLPAELVQAVWDAIPYESVPFRYGWEEWRRGREAAGDLAD